MFGDLDLEDLDLEELETTVTKDLHQAAAQAEEASVSKVAWPNSCRQGHLHSG